MKCIVCGSTRVTAMYIHRHKGEITDVTVCSPEHLVEYLEKDLHEKREEFFRPRTAYWDDQINY